MKSKLLQINIEVNSGSTGRIAEQIGLIAIKAGWESYITFARGYNPSASQTIKIGNKLTIIWHVIQTRIFGNHLHSSTLSTYLLIKKIKAINPDIIHLHQIHGYYLNVKILFNFLVKYNKPVVWTLHDCWAFTGHCTHFTIENCMKWQTECNMCPKKGNYPSSLFFDKSRSSFLEKKVKFNQIESIVFVGVSQWVADLARKSFLNGKPIITINNGVDTSIFNKTIENSIFKKYLIDRKKKIILGVGTEWNNRKGLDDYILLNSALSSQFQIVLVGINSQIQKRLPKGIICINRTEDIFELNQFYSHALLLLCLSYQESFGLTPIEAFACGTPAVVYDNTALSELITPETGIKVKTGDVKAVLNAINEILQNGKEKYTENCVRRAKDVYEINNTYSKYIRLYNELEKN